MQWSRKKLDPHPQSNIVRKKKNVIIVCQFEEISLWTDLSKPHCCLIQGGGSPEGYKQTEG